MMAKVRNASLNRERIAADCCLWVKAITANNGHLREICRLKKNVLL